MEDNTAASATTERQQMQIAMRPDSTPRWANHRSGFQKSVLLLCLCVGIFEIQPCGGFLLRHPTTFRAKRQILPIQNLYTEFDSHGPPKDTSSSSWPVNATTTASTATFPERPSRRLSNEIMPPIASKKKKVFRYMRKSIPTVTAEPEEPKPKKYNLQLLLIDHYDSFTYNLYDMLAQLCEKPPIVLAKDACENWSDVVKQYGANTIDGVILSPGPGTPTHPEDIGTLSPSIIRENSDLPILGVCLGHQIMGHVYGATVDLCGPVHGQVRAIEQQQPVMEVADLLWKDIPPQLNVTRYHSLAVTLPNDHEDHQVPLRATAYSSESHPNDRILMGMSHVTNPHVGVQFHPESIGSQFGHQLLGNFCEICQGHKTDKEADVAVNQKLQNQQHHNPPRPHGHDRQSTRTNGSVTNGSKSPLSHADSEKNTIEDKKSKYKVLVHKVETRTSLSPLQVFEEFLSKERYSVWLDTSRGIQSNPCTSAANAVAPQSYSSILGAGDRPIEYFGKEYDAKLQGLFRQDTATGNRIKLHHDDIFSFLQEEHENPTNVVGMVSFQDGDHDDGKVTLSTVSDDGSCLPFDFRGGHVGYLGYEVRHDSERFLEQQEQGSRAKWKPLEDSLLSPPPKEKQESTERIPTAAFLFLDKSWVYDHANEAWYLIGLVEQDAPQKEGAESAAMEWMRSTAERMTALSDKHQHTSVTSYQIHTSGERNAKEQDFSAHDTEASSNEPKLKGVSDSLSRSIKFSPNRSRTCYNQNFADCQEQIRLGESYELCLTNQLETQVRVPAKASSPLGLYKVLRKRNPAPFSAFLNWNTGPDVTKLPEESSSMAICCSSPERFVSVKRKTVERTADKVNGSSGSEMILEVEAKPIKGTCARVLPEHPEAGLSAAEKREDERRALELKASVKNQAENLMIVDLLRNDLSRVCEVGSVHVSKLMDIESYATVHQMVSTIRGRLNPGKANAVDVLKATFPGGSMTGAPKIRTMEILERLEEGASRGPYSGCLGYISMNGSMDMNIVIRSAVLQPTASAYGDAEIGGRDWRVSIGAGGAITALSESTDEYEEMILKASAVIGAVEEWAGATQGAAVQHLSEL